MVQDKLDDRGCSEVCSKVSKKWLPLPEINLLRLDLRCPYIRPGKKILHSPSLKQPAPTAKARCT